MDDLNSESAQDVDTGTDIAGEVTKVAPDVKNFNVGDKVVAMLPPPGLEYAARRGEGGGGLAEYAAVKATQAVIRPHHVSAAAGALLATAPLTGNGELPKDGSMRHIAKILAPKSHVTATCGSRNIDFILGLGADEVTERRGRRSRRYVLVDEAARVALARDAVRHIFHGMQKSGGPVFGVCITEAQNEQPAVGSSGFYRLESHRVEPYGGMDRVYPSLGNQSR
ncbi:hypothetical protein OROMI_010806 [Orobanche minor]